MKTTTYGFSKQNEIGKAGEREIEKWLQRGGLQIIDVSDDSYYQKAGVDRLIMLSDGILKTVECKTEPKARETGNIFFETISVSKSDKKSPGWGWTSQADYWIFLIPGQEILVFHPGELRALVWEYRKSLREVPVNNGTYKTVGYPISLDLAKRRTLQNIALDSHGIPKKKPDFVS
jgi:hypothetical protein